MQYLMLSPTDRTALLARLQSMPDFLDGSLGTLAAPWATVPGPDGGFSPVEHGWHLADLEREGYARRIHRLRVERDPWLPDFDGARLARARRYTSRSLAEGLAVFRRARLRTLATLRSLPAGDWTRRGEQEGVGPVTLCDIPAMMAEHDEAHRREIEAWRQAHRPDRRP